MAARAKKARDNDDEISRLRGRKMLTLGLFYGSIAIIPLGCFGCCGLAMLIRQETVQAIFGIAALLSPFVGLGGMLLMWSDRSRYGRSVDLALQADELGLAFLEKPAKRELKIIRSFQVFRDPTSDDGRNGMAGTHEDVAVVVMDYSAAWGVGQYAYLVNQTVIVLEDVVAEVPDFVLYPKSMFDKLADAVGLGGKPIRVPNAEKFNKRYGLYAEKAVAAVGLFKPELTKLCLQEDNLVLEATDGNLLVYWYETHLAPADVPERLQTALEIARALQGAE